MGGSRKLKGRAAWSTWHRNKQQRDPASNKAEGGDRHPRPSSEFCARPVNACVATHGHTQKEDGSLERETGERTVTEIDVPQLKRMVLVHRARG